MQFKIQKKYLANVISQATNAISSRTVNPILSGIKLDIQNDGVTLTGSNSDITIQSHINRVNELTNQAGEKIEEEIITDIVPGSIVLPVPHFPEIIKKLPTNEIFIKVEDNFKTIIQSGKAVFTLYGQSVEEYPRVQMQKQDYFIELEVSQLKSLIQQTVFAVSQMETRPILTGIKVSIQADEITFTATDSHRLSLRKSKISPHELEEADIVIPGKSLQELNKIIDINDGTVKMAVLQNQVLFFTDQVYFLSRLLSGNYPDTSRLIPSDSQTRLQIHTKDLIHTIERAQLLTSRDQNNVVRLDTMDNNQIEITGNSPEIGNVKEDINVVAMNGEPLKISFSSRYLLDSLKTIESDIVQIDFTGAMRPFIITIPENDQVLQLILPVRTF